MTIYKHMESKYLADFCAGRSVMIGTLSKFRQEEAHAPGIGDRLEGRIERKFTKAFDRLERGSDDSKLLKSVGIDIAGENVVLNNVFVQNSLPDLYIFCASVSSHAKVSQGYDAVARIIDERAFGEALLEALRPHGATHFVHDGVQYRDDIEGNLFIDRRPAPVPNPFYKRPIFSAQMEYRFAFLAREPLQPTIIVKPRFIPGLVEPVRK